MTKSTPEVSAFFVSKSSPEAFISPLFFKNSFTLDHPDDFCSESTGICERWDVKVCGEERGYVFTHTTNFPFLSKIQYCVKSSFCVA